MDESFVHPVVGFLKPRSTSNCHLPISEKHGPKIEEKWEIDALSSTPKPEATRSPSVCNRCCSSSRERRATSRDVAGTIAPPFKSPAKRLETFGAKASKRTDSPNHVVRRTVRSATESVSLRLGELPCVAEEPGAILFLGQTNRVFPTVGHGRGEGNCDSQTWPVASNDLDFIK